MTDYLDPDPSADNDELDLIACVLNGWDPTDVDLKPDAFRDPKHEAAWRAACTVAQAGNSVNPTTVRMALGAAGDKAAPWLLEVYGRPVVPSNAPALAARVRRGAELRALVALGRRILQQASADGAEPDAVLDLIRQAADEPMGTVRDMETVADAIPRVVDQIQRGTASGLSTPWPDLDRKIHGLADDRLYIVAARPGVGKSLLGQALAMHWAQRHGLPTYFASLEMSTEELTMRALAQASRVDLDNLLSGDMSERLWAQLGAKIPVHGADLVHVCSDPGQTLDSIRNGARQLQRRHGLGLIVVDYLQLVTPADRRANREQQVAALSRGLKLLAKELHVPVVAMSQVRRQAEGERNKRPTMNDLRESGAIEQDADAVLILHIPDQTRQDEGELFVAKARAGRRGGIPLQMLTSWASVVPSARAYADDGAPIDDYRPKAIGA